MKSPLAGSLARTIGKAMAGLFLPATLTRGATTYPCRAIFDQWGKDSGSGGALTNPDVKALVLANSLAVELASGDLVALQGSTFVVVSNIDTKPAVSTDPARAVWTLIGKFSPVGSGVLAAYATTAASLGTPYRVYRSTGNNPLSTAPIETTPVVVTSAKSSGFDFKRLSTFEDLLFAMQADFSNIRIGDYMVGARTYFIADMPALRPVLAVQCNATVSVYRLPGEPAGTAGFGSQPYQEPQTASGASIYDEAPVISGIPCSLQESTQRRNSIEQLPGDTQSSAVRMGYFAPSSFPKGSLLARDYVVDDLGTKYQVIDPHWDVMGYRAALLILEM